MAYAYAYAMVPANGRLGYPSIESIVGAAVSDCTELSANNGVMLSRPGRVSEESAFHFRSVSDLRSFSCLRKSEQGVSWEEPLKENESIVRDDCFSLQQEVPVFPTAIS